MTGHSSRLANDAGDCHPQDALDHSKWNDANSTATHKLLYLVDTPGMVSLSVTELGFTLINYAVLQFLLHFCLVYWVDFLGFVSIQYRSYWVID